MTTPERLPVSIQTLHAELADRAWTGSFEEIMDAGGSAHVKTVKGRRYWYWQSLTRNGARPPARYLGPDTPVLRRRISERTGVADARKERVNMVRSLRAGRIPGPDALSGNVLAALSKAGAFRLRAVVVGSLAFQCYAPMLGFTAPGAMARTGDVDVGQFPAISIAVRDRIEPDLISVLKSADSRFEAVPSPFDPRSTLRYAIRDGSQERFAVDILAPLRGPPRDRPVHLPALGGDAQPLRFLDFLIYQEIEAVVLHGPGIPVKVPAPERFAVHKLLVASRRRKDASGLDKARKDMAQADILCRVLVQDRPDDLIDAWSEFLDRGPAWRAAVAQPWKTLPDEVKDVLPPPDVPSP
ncbi:MAG: hypothetical protein F4Y60_08885 [Boseongicola sp. SB0664_bin_43]|uniref:Nucleotidyltransferase-like domain-containing protein n=1 Tax=Boseongicola sp. SB0664_bin_43 TaxID=2604844 RepID=A0A6B0Y1B9_9RHOB|nr:hypothetical protein [Boseongicola sp. SB0664_bin_43]